MRQQILFRQEETLGICLANRDWNTLLADDPFVADKPLGLGASFLPVVFSLS